MIFLKFPAPRQGDFIFSKSCICWFDWSHWKIWEVNAKISKIHDFFFQDNLSGFVNSSDGLESCIEFVPIISYSNRDDFFEEINVKMNLPQLWMCFLDCWCGIWILAWEINDTKFDQSQRNSGILIDAFHPWLINSVLFIFYGMNLVGFRFSWNQKRNDCRYRCPSGSPFLTDPGSFPA